MKKGNCFRLMGMGMLVAGLAFGATGCGSDEEAPEGEGAAEACEHMREGPSEAIAAQADANDVLSPLAEEHRRYDLNLAGTAPNHQGWVALPIDEAGEHHLYLNRDVPLSIETSSGETVEAEKVAFEGCAEIAAEYHVTFGVGTYNLRLGPAADQTVSIVVEPAAGEEHGHE